MALPAKSPSLKINWKIKEFQEMTRDWKVLIFSKDIYTNVKYKKSFKKNSSQSFILHQNL